MAEEKAAEGRVSRSEEGSLGEEDGGLCTVCGGGCEGV